MMTPPPTQTNLSATLPYAPSFIDRFMTFIQRLPWSYWLTLLVLFILQSTLLHILSWVDGWVPPFIFNPLLLLFPLWLWGPLTIMIFLNSVASAAVSSFSQLLDIDDEQLNRLKEEFTTMPAKSVFISSGIWAIIYFLISFFTFEAFYVSPGLGPFLTWFILLVGLASYVTGSAIYYYSLRLLRLVNRTVKMVRQFNLFHLDPIYAFSRVTSLTGIAWMIMLSLTLLFFPIQLANAPVVAVLGLQVLLALAAFILPLRFVNHHLVSEKRRLLTELDQRVRSTLERLHRCIDNNQTDELNQLISALTALNTEREILTKIPTWPWRAGTLPGFLSAIGLPLVLFILQLIIKNLVGE